MRNFAFAAAFAGALAAGFAASASTEAPARGDMLGAGMDGLRAALTEQGYDVRKIEREDGALEAYALKDGKRYEFYVNEDTGEILKVKEND